METTEELSGYGRLLDAIGETIATAQYLVIVRQKSISGRIFASVPSLIGHPVELELEDRRRWPCVIQSGDGDLVSRGSIS